MARLLLVTFLVWVSAFEALAADKFDAWINVFSIVGCDIQAVEGGRTARAVGEVELQSIVASLEGKPLGFSIQRSRAGWGEDVVIIAQSKSDMAQRINADEDEMLNFRHIEVRNGRGVAADYRGCIYVLAALYTSALNSEDFEFVIDGVSCGSHQAILSYFANIRVSTRVSNLSDFAASRARSSAQ